MLNVQGKLSAQSNAPPAGAHFVKVSIDKELGKIEASRVVAAHDVGRAINPQLVEGQIEGGVCQGLGFALMEGTPNKQGNRQF